MLFVLLQIQEIFAHGIENAIMHAWRKTAVDDLLEYYTARINPETGVPTPMELIYHYAEKIEREL